MLRLKAQSRGMEKLLAHAITRREGGAGLELFLSR